MLGNVIGSGLIVNVKEFQDAYPKVLQWFFAYPSREIGLNDLSEALKISKTTAKRIVDELVKEEFLKKEILGKIWRISCNQEHIYNYSKKIAYNLMLVYESGIAKKIKKIIQNPRAVVLFGSYRKGDDTEKSDIDIAVEVLGNQELKIENIGVIKKFGYRKNVPVNIHLFSKNNADLNLFANIANGIVLEGFLEVRP